MKTILLISPYWKEEHRWMVSSYKFAELWQRIGYRVVVVCMGSETSVEKVSDTLTIYRKKDFFLPDPLNFGIALGFTGLVRKLIKQEKPDLVVCNKVLFWTSFCLIPLRLTGHKILLLTDALVGMTWQPRGVLPKIIMTLGAWTVGWLVLLCGRRVVFFHPQPEPLLKRLGIYKKSQVIPTGIDPSPFRAQPPEPGERIQITYTGRLESIKGLDDFLPVASSLVEEYSNVDVQVVGWYKEGHPQVEQYKDHISFTGLSNDIPGVLAGTDIFVLPSYSEGLSNSLMEAMASSCACVVSEVGGNRFLVQNGVSGFQFPAGDREALQAHLRRLIEDPAKRAAMGSEARKRIDAVFSWKKVGQQYGQLFDDLLQNG